MTSGDRDDPLANDPEWQAAMLRHELSKQCNPLHSNTEIEMARGRLLVERNVNAQCQLLARDLLSKEFNPDHVPDPDAPNGKITPAERRHRDTYRNRMGAQVPK